MYIYIYRCSYVNSSALFTQTHTYVPKQIIVTAIPITFTTEISSPRTFWKDNAKATIKVLCVPK